MQNIDKFLTEFLGTFFLTLVIALTGGNFIAIGAVLAALVYAGGDISGGHYNPAVTLGIFIRKKISLITALEYFIVQILGALTACLTYLTITKRSFLPIPSTDLGLGSSFLVEMLFTFALVYVVLLVATTENRKGNEYFGIAIGLILLVGVASGGSISGGVYNPAVTIGSYILSIFKGSFNFLNFITYLFSQFLGGGIAGALYLLMNSKQKEDKSGEKNDNKPKSLNKIQMVSNSLVKNQPVKP